MWIQRGRRYSTFPSGPGVSRLALCQRDNILKFPLASETLNPSQDLEGGSSKDMMSWETLTMFGRHFDLLSVQRTHRRPSSVEDR